MIRAKIKIKTMSIRLSFFPGRAVALSVAVAAALSGCSKSFDTLLPDRRPDYKQSTLAQPLEIPPDLTGSTMDRFIRHASRPCLVTPGAFRPVRKILAGVDGSPSAARALHEAVELANALGAPLVILADEATGNLDSKNADDLHQLFFDLRDKYNQTFVIVTHNTYLADTTDRKLVMKDGLIL